MEKHEEKTEDTTDIVQDAPAERQVQAENQEDAASLLKDEKGRGDAAIEQEDAIIEPEDADHIKEDANWNQDEIAEKEEATNEDAWCDCTDIETYPHAGARA